MLSRVQQFILEECFEYNRAACPRRVIDKKYGQSRSKSKKENFRKIITQSIERLIERGLLVGYCVKTKEKLYITKIRLTIYGRRAVKQARDASQKRLPFKSVRRSYVQNKNRKF